MTRSILSPWLTRYADDLNTNPTQARQSLVAELHKAGGPILEHLDDGTLVTFVYLGPGEHVALWCQLSMSPSGEPRTLERINGTDVWYTSIPLQRNDIRISYRFHIDDPVSLMTVDELMASMQQPNEYEQLVNRSLQSARIDPFNPDRLTIPSQGADGSAIELHSSVLSLPGAATASWLRRPQTLGTLTSHQFRSSTFENERTVTILTPPNYHKDDGPYPLIVVLDGEYHLGAGFSEILSAMTEDGDIPPSVALFVHNATPLSRMAEMNCNPDLATFYAEELLPWIRSEYSVTVDPAQSVVTGASYGGLGSAWLAMECSDLFGNVLSMSGSFWWGSKDNYGGDEGPFSFGNDHEPEWLTRRIAQQPKKNVRWWLDAGLYEHQALSGGPSLLTANRHLRTVLHAKGYDVHYEEFPGGHDHASWQLTFGAGLRHLLGTQQD